MPPGAGFLDLKPLDFEPRTLSAAGGGSTTTEAAVGASGMGSTLTVAVSASTVTESGAVVSGVKSYFVSQGAEDELRGDPMDKGRIEDANPIQLDVVVGAIVQEGWKKVTAAVVGASDDAAGVGGA